MFIETVSVLPRSSLLLHQFTRPQGNVVSDQLHDERRLLAVALNLVQICDRIVKRLSRHVQRFLRILHDLVVKYRLVQCKA